MSQNVLEPEQIKAAGSASTKEDAIREAGAILLKAGAVTAEYVDYMMQREALTSTYMGNFLAIPHGTNEGKDTILASALSFVRYTEPIDWDGNEVRFVVGIAGKDNGHMEILSKIALIFSDEDEVQKLLDAPGEAAILAILDEVNN
ncbi:PTS sugar transporter subunit IIA [Parafrigoribacterium soli]|uniref:PTS sugar transporter subunit IIA n=1 Tax=Parafrigoribacterium soli TaxID=3144663 RepID=UPI0032EB7EAC